MVFWAEGNLREKNQSASRFEFFRVESMAWRGWGMAGVIDAKLAARAKGARSNFANHPHGAPMEPRTEKLAKIIDFYSIFVTSNHFAMTHSQKS